MSVVSRYFFGGSLSEACVLGLWVFNFVDNKLHSTHCREFIIKERVALCKTLATAANVLTWTLVNSL